MRHDAFGCAHAHDPVEIEKLLREEHGLGVESVYSLSPESVHVISFMGKPWRSAIVSRDLEELFCFVEGETEMEVEEILSEARIDRGEEEVSL